MTNIQKVAVMGAGTMRHSLALAFAQGGCDVWLNDIQGEILDKAKKLIISNLRTKVGLRVLDTNQSTTILDRILLR
jgi:3-hydroxyacyl-CoA dehydrogenase